MDGHGLCGFSLIMRISASASQWTLQFQRERLCKPFSQACKHPTDLSHAEGVKPFLFNRRSLSRASCGTYRACSSAPPRVGRCYFIGRPIKGMFGGKYIGSMDFEAAGCESGICNVDNLSLVAPQSVPLGGLPVLFSRKPLPGRCRTFLAECSRHLRHGSKLMQATTRTHTFHSHVCRIFNCHPLERTLRQGRNRRRCD